MSLSTITEVIRGQLDVEVDVIWGLVGKKGGADVCNMFVPTVGRGEGEQNLEGGRANDWGARLVEVTANGLAVARANPAHFALNKSTSD